MMKDFDRCNKSKKLVDNSMNTPECDILIPQLRMFDRKRLRRKIGMLPIESFDSLNNEIKNLFPIVTGSIFMEPSEAEASVCKLSIADQVALSNELSYLASKGEINLQES